MHNVSEKTWFEAIRNNDLSEVEKLIEQGFDVNIQDADGSTAMHIAADEANDELVFTLLCNKVNVHQKDSCGNNALHRAAAKGHQEIVQYLIDWGVDSSGVKHMDVALDLLARNSDGKTARMLASDHGYTDIVQVLKEEEWGMAIAKNDIQHVKKLLQEGITAEMLDFGLRLAIRWHHMEIIELLLINGADVHKKDHFGETPFYVAVNGGNITIIELLLKHGADVHTITTEGQTVLHCAAAHGYKEIVELLIEQGVDKHAKTRRGETVLHVACKFGHIDTVELLLQSGIDVHACNRSSQTALDCVLDRYSNKEHFNRIADLLIAHGAQEQRST